MIHFSKISSRTMLGFLHWRSQKKKSWNWWLWSILKVTEKALGELIVSWFEWELAEQSVFFNAPDPWNMIKFLFRFMIWSWQVMCWVSVSVTFVFMFSILHSSFIYQFFFWTFSGAVASSVQSINLFIH